MADIRTKYPSTSTIAITISLGGLATSASLNAGQESTAIDNRTNVDLDHIVSGRIRTGTSPTVNTTIEIWAYAPISISSGTPTYPDVLDGTDSVETFTSRNVLLSSLRRLHTIIVDSNSDRDYFMPPTSIKEAFGQMPQYWGLFVTHNTGVALNATGGNHVFHYDRIQAQTV